MSLMTGKGLKLTLAYFISTTIGYETLLKEE